MGPLSWDFSTTSSLVGVHKGYTPCGSKFLEEIGVGVKNRRLRRASAVGASSQPDAKSMAVGVNKIAVSQAREVVMLKAWSGLPEVASMWQAT
jgi:hypothetical protein